MLISRIEGLKFGFCDLDVVYRVLKSKFKLSIDVVYRQINFEIRSSIDDV